MWSSYYNQLTKQSPFICSNLKLEHSTMQNATETLKYIGLNCIYWTESGIPSSETDTVACNWPWAEKSIAFNAPDPIHSNLRLRPLFSNSNSNSESGLPLRRHLCHCSGDVRSMTTTRLRLQLPFNVRCSAGGTANGQTWAENRPGQCLVYLSTCSCSNCQIANSCHK